MTRSTTAMAAYKAPTDGHRRRSTTCRTSTSTRSSHIPSEDFLDLSHLRPRGRAVWQAELARQLAALYDDGTLRTEL